MLFAFGRTPNTFYFAHGTNNYWQGIPQSLADYLQTEPILRALAIGDGGAYFWKEMPDTDTSGKYFVSPETSIHYPEVKHVYDRDELINWVAFGQNGAYIVDTETRLYQSDPSVLRAYEHGGGLVPVRCASFGPSGSWAVVENDGTIRSCGLPDGVRNVLARHQVRRVELSPISAGSYFIEYTNGTLDFHLPSDWHVAINDVASMVSQLDEPAETFGTSLHQNIVFTFGPIRELYCMSNQQGSTSWRGCSQALIRYLARPGRTDAVSMGEGGAFFWRQDSEYFVSSATELFYPDVWDIWQSSQPVNWVAFGPNGYYIVDTEARVYASRPDSLLRTYSESGNQVPLRCASFGYGGSWVVVEDDGVIRSWGLSPEIRKAMLQGNVRNIQLSQVCPAQFYIEYMDNTSDWSLPLDWHANVSEMEGALPKPESQVERLDIVSERDQEFASVSYQFATSWRHTEKRLPRVRFVYKIVLRADILEKYEAYLDRIGHEQKLFHGTSRACSIGDGGRNLELCYDANCSLCAIMRSSYRVSLSRSSGMFGTGIYTSSTSSKAAGYSRNFGHSSYHAMILNKVAVGRPFFTGAADVGRTEPPDGFNSVCGLPGDQLNHDETIVYDDDAIRPWYLILYDAVN